MLVTVTGSNVSQEILSGVTVLSGASHITSNYNYLGTRIGVGIRLASSKLFKVSVFPKANDAAHTALGATEIMNKTTAADRDAVTYQLVARKNNFAITNTDATDLTITYMTVTDFMS